MPNFCNNVVTLMHDDCSMLERAANAVQQGKLLQEFIKPEDADHLDELWTRENWGCKWDVGDDDSITEFDEENNVLDLYFDSPWTPPIAAYETLVSEYGFTIQAYFYEPGNEFCGSWEGDPDLGFDLQEFDIEGNSDWVEENIPEIINDIFSISENMRIDEEDETC